MFPELPEWDAIHPLVVHFPIALLMIAPVFMVIALIARKPAWIVSAAIVLAMGTLGAWVAYYSGEAGEVYWRTHGDLSDEVDLLLSQHHVAGGQARLMATVSLVAFIAWGIAAVKVPKKPALLIVVGLVVVLGHLGVMLRLAQASHMGGRLVHEYTITAPYSTN